MTDLIEAAAAQVTRQTGRQTEKPGDNWQAQYAKGVEIARNMQQQRGYKVPDQQGK